MTDTVPARSPEDRPPVEIGFLLFPGVQQLDLTGPYEVFATLPGTRVHLVASRPGPVLSVTGLPLTPTATFADCLSIDVICVPGGLGMLALLDDAEALAFVRRQAEGARFVTSVCTGALVLGAAGLLRGRRATTHWALHDALAAFGAIPVAERVVRDGNVVTGGGITAGIDFALELAAEIADPVDAEAVGLLLEYAPSPPFASGRPETASAAVLARCAAWMAEDRAGAEARIAAAARRVA
ncbi:DJ-1/PfpI family protein [Methylobacterium durans]|uniref:DJ-1/PfpI family protein n=1 Tax=Methylobacterium durans TaxID=2202825 RepID=UPI002AFF446E|nr:DJ-1/PfpI family protein [Methylobacterium durans]MEA1831312.1 DJ-1/PfpI family protein [Methylobacterium durans]